MIFSKRETFIGEAYQSIKDEEYLFFTWYFLKRHKKEKAKFLKENFAEFNNDKFNSSFKVDKHFFTELIDLGIIIIKDKNIDIDKLEYLKIFVQKNTAEKFIKTTLEKWKNDELSSPIINILKSQKQIEIIAKHLYELLCNFPKTNLLVESKKNELGEIIGINLTATLLFLESIGDIDILSFTFKNSSIFHKPAFRINIKKKFFSDFRYNNNKIKFNFEKLSKNSAYKIIEFIPTKTLRCGENIYDLSEGCLRYHLMNLAFKNKGNVNKHKLVDQSEKFSTKKLPRNLGLFRAYLRKKFKSEFSEDELFFRIEGDEIVFKQDIFLF